MADVFISYSRTDIAFARLIRDALQLNHVETWIDWARIPVGARWWPEICGAIAESTVFMTILSRASLRSGVCRDEINEALTNNKRIIPVLLDDLTPGNIGEFAPELPQVNWIVFRRDHCFRLEEAPGVESEPTEDHQVALPLPQFEAALAELDTAIHTDWDWVRYHTHLQVRALHWESRAKSTRFLLQEGDLDEAEQMLARAASRDPRPTFLQLEFVRGSKELTLAASPRWWRKDEESSRFAPDHELVCVNCAYSYTFTPSEHLPIPSRCQECGFEGRGRFAQ